MKQGAKFDALSNAIGESTSYQVNAAGTQLIKQYHGIIGALEQAMTPILQPITTRSVDMAKQAAVQIVSSINSSKTGNDMFNLMSRLDTLTNGGRTPIQGNSFAFNQNDNILQYLDKV